MKNKKSPIFLTIFLTTFFTTIICWNAQLFSTVENFVPNSAIIKTSPDRLIFDKTVFDYTNFNFFLGARYDATFTATTAKAYAITRAQGTSIYGITPEKILVPSDDGTSSTEEDNKLYGARILNLGLFNNSYPIVSYRQDSGYLYDSNILYLINAYNDGKMNIATESALQDATPGDTKQIKALTGSDTYVFAAVSATGLNWNDQTDPGDYRGIAVVKPTLNAPKPTIKQLAATDLSTDAATAAAKILDVKAASTPILISFSEATPPSTQNPIIRAFLGTDVDMYWDSELKRLFIGLSEVSRDSKSLEGGCFSVLVGRIEKTNIGTASEKDNDLALSPILNTPTRDKLYNATYKNSNKFMVGFYYDGVTADGGDVDIKITTKKVRVMHTSTGKSYLIVNCEVNEPTPGYNKVFALPILGSKTPSGVAIADAQIGTLSKISGVTPTFDAIPTTAAEMPQFDVTTPINSTPGIVVGQQTLDIGNLTDLFVYGDSVFICLNNPGSTQTSGIFESTALFNSAGIIIGWTPWQRVMGDVQYVYGGGIDVASNFYFLAGDATNTTLANTIRISKWGTTEEANQSETINKDNGNPIWTKDENRNLSALLSSIFPQDQVGVLQMINFDEYTPGFSQQNFSMMVAIGYDKVALIQTLQRNPGFQTNPITHFNDGTLTDGTPQNVFVFKNDPVLEEIAPLCFAEVSRDATGNTGWLFVGGYNGVAVLCNKLDGTGWDALAGLSNLGTGADHFPLSTYYSFKKLTPMTPTTVNFSNVRKLASLVSSDPKKLFIQTKDNLYSIVPKAGEFTTGNVTATPMFTNLPDTLKFTDFLIIPTADQTSAGALPASDNFKFILGSTYGLLTGIYKSGSGMVTLSGLGSATNDPVLHLDYISKTKGLNSVTGMLYALSANYLKNFGKIYRYSVNGVGSSATDTVKRITTDKSPFIDLQNFRGNFITDGAFGFSMIAKGPSNNLMTGLYEIAPTQTEIGSIDDFLELNDTNWYIGVITRNTASGSWIVPGDWGVKVNE